jgi:hypothetical protein
VWVGLALLIGTVLHLADAVWIGRYLCILGTLLILASARYSLRKRKIIASGKSGKLLIEHERLVWLGSLMVLVHAGIRDITNCVRCHKSSNGEGREREGGGRDD